MSKGALLSGLFSMVAAYLYLRRRKNLGLRMNLIAAILMDTQELFPEHLPADREERFKVVKKFRELWIKLARDAGKMARTDPVGRVEDFEVPSREAHRTIKVRLYRPADTPSDKKLPVVLQSHGGGWVYGNLDVYDRFCRMLSARSGTIVCAVDYRLAPDHPFPAGLEDCEDVLNWIWSEPSKLVDDFKGDPKSCGLGVAGDSAGGNICAVLAVYAKNRGIKLDIQALIYPATAAFCTRFWRQPSYVLPSDSIVVNAAAPVLTAKGLLNCWELYLSNPEVEATNPRASPILFSVEELRGVAKAFVTTADADVLKDEGLEYYKLLKRADVDATYKNYEDTIHGFASLNVCNHHERGVWDVAKAIAAAFSERNEKI